MLHSPKKTSWVRWFFDLPIWTRQVQVILVRISSEMRGINIPTMATGSLVPMDIPWKQMDPLPLPRNHPRGSRGRLGHQILQRHGTAQRRRSERAKSRGGRSLNTWKSSIICKPSRKWGHIQLQILIQSHSHSKKTHAMGNWKKNNSVFFHIFVGV